MPSNSLSSLRLSLAAIVRGLRVPGFYLALLASLVAWVAAYQHKTTYVVDVGGLHDDAYVTGFHAKERNPQLDYRWTASEARIRLPGIGNRPVELTLDVIGFRPSGEPPVVTVDARGQTFTLQTQSGPGSKTFPVERGPDPWSGDFEVRISSPTFSPEGDPRELGVIVDRVIVRPAGSGLRPFVLPSVPALLLFLVGLMLAYAIVLITVRRSGVAVGTVAALGAAIACLLLLARPELGLLAEHVPSLGLWGVVLALAGRACLDVLLPLWRRYDLALSRDLAASLGSIAFVLAFLLRFGGLTYPQFLTSDLMLHVHNIQFRVLAGQWVFPGALPDGTPVPYPPALYVLVAPLAGVFGSSDDALGLILKWVASLLDAGACLALAWAGSRLWGALAGGLAALAYACALAPFDLLSAGNYTNLFAQATLNLTLLCALVLVTGRARMQPTAGWALLSMGFLLTVLGHYGMMLGALLIMALFAVWLLAASLRGMSERYGVPSGASLNAKEFASGSYPKSGRPEFACPVVGAWVVALIAAAAAYYWRFAPEMWSQLTGVLGRLTGGDTGGGAGVDSPLVKLGGKVDRLIGTLPLLVAAFGLALAGGIGAAARALLGAWLGASAAFALLDQVVGDAVRWYYLAAAAVALLAGRYLGLVAQRGRAARVLVALSVLALVWQLLNVWVGDYIFTRYH